LRIGIALGLYYGDHVGGAEVQTSYLVDHFLHRGHEVALIHFGERNVEGPVEKKGRFSRYQVRIPKGNIKFTSYFNRGAIFRTLDEMKVEILYQRGDFHFSDLISTYGDSRRIPVVSAVSMERHCYPEKLTFDHMLPLKLIDKFLKRRYYRKSNLILAQTEHQKGLLKKNLGLDSIVIGNGHLIPEPPFIKDDPPLISWVANIKPIKRPFEFLSICKGLSGEGLHFAMVGRPDPSRYQKDLEREIASIPNLDYMGEVRPEAANEVISRSSIMINTSESEGFSNTYIQAWMRETPVIALSADPDGVIVRKGIGAVTGTVQNAVRTIKGLLSDSDRLIAMGKAARAHAIDHHDILMVGDKHLELFRKEIEKATGR
jgi:glycosyltransferase involved in cell wall biosynthesis